MDASHASLSPEALLADCAWVRAVARGLVADPATADDLAQDAWIAARGARGAPAGRAPWLAAIVRNLAGKRRRSDARRARREELGARCEALPSTSELVERAEMQRAIVDAVLALDEPYRSTILLGHLEGLSSVEIARVQGVADGTVRWRARRGLELLRADLERRRGADWLASCALVAGLLDALAPAKLAVTSLALPIGLAAAGIATIALALPAWRESSTTGDGSGEAVALAALERGSIVSLPSEHDVAAERELDAGGISAERLPLEASTRPDAPMPRGALGDTDPPAVATTILDVEAIMPTAVIVADASDIAAAMSEGLAHELQRNVGDALARSGGSVDALFDAVRASLPPGAAIVGVSEGHFSAPIAGCDARELALRLLRDPVPVRIR